LKRILLFLMSAAACGATTLVAVWTPDEIVLAADSKLMYDGATAGANTVCKIQREGETFFAFSGLVDDPASGFNAAAIARRAAQAAGGAERRVAAFEKYAVVELKKAIEGIRYDSPSDYKYLRQGHPVLQAIFALPGPTAPVLAIAGFQLDEKGEVRSFSRVVADGSDSAGARVIYAGQQGHIRSYLKSHAEWQNEPPAVLVRKLVELEIGDGTGRVGGPVDIVSVGRASTWIVKKNGCE
jgi:hypothetical protein